MSGTLRAFLEGTTQYSAFPPYAIPTNWWCSTAYTSAGDGDCMCTCSDGHSYEGVQHHDEWGNYWPTSSDIVGDCNPGNNNQCGTPCQNYCNARLLGTDVCERNFGDFCKWVPDADIDEHGTCQNKGSHLGVPCNEWNPTTNNGNKECNPSVIRGNPDSQNVGHHDEWGGWHAYSGDDPSDLEIGGAYCYPAEVWVVPSQYINWNTSNFDFRPDADIRSTISIGSSNSVLYKYYDRDLQPLKYEETSAPITAQVFCYPRKQEDFSPLPNSFVDCRHTIAGAYCDSCANNDGDLCMTNESMVAGTCGQCITNEDGAPECIHSGGQQNLVDLYDLDCPVSSTFGFFSPDGVESPIISSSLESGNMYVGFLDWGDGTPVEYKQEPKKLTIDKTLKHVYDKS